MRLTPQQLITQLSTVLDGSLVRLAVESYVEMQQRFLVGDWQPAELDGGRLCEAIARCLYQMDTGRVSHNKSVADVRVYLMDEDNSRAHRLGAKDRKHIAKVIEVVYKFRSDRGAVHISPDYNANYMDSMLILHAGKWIFAEFLRLAWNQDRKVIAETIAQLVQLEHSLIHELDGKPLVLAKGISAPSEILLLLNHASNNRLGRADIEQQAHHHKPTTLAVAITRLINSRDIRDLGNGEVALTPNGQRRVMQEILPKYSPT
jgi:hypothetical protein